MAQKDGFVLFGGELNTEKAKSVNQVQQILAQDYANATGWAQMKNHLEGIKFDTLVTSGAINMSLSTGSWIGAVGVSSRYTNNLYLGSGTYIQNNGFETVPYTSGANWCTGTNIHAGSYSIGSDNGWANKTGGLTFFASYTNLSPAGSIYANQNIGPFIGSGLAYLAIDYAAAGPAAVSFVLNGSPLVVGLSSGARSFFDVSFMSGASLPLTILVTVPGGLGGNGSVVVDNLQLYRAGSANTIPDSFITTLTNTTNAVTAMTFFVNGSFPAGTLGSYFLSANSGTGWDVAAPGSFIISGQGFTSFGSGVTVKVDLYSSGASQPILYEYGVQWSEE